MTTLSNAISKIGTDSLAKEIAFVLCTKFTERLVHDRYMVAYNATLLKDWEQVAVVQTGDNLTRFDQLTCVKLDEINDIEFKQSNPIFIKVVLNELSIIGRIL